MFARFTDRARDVMARANRKAQALNHDYVGAEDILLGLAKEGTGVGAIALKNLGVDIGRLRAEVEKRAKSGAETVPPDKPAQAPRAKKVIEYALEEAQALHHNDVGTGHILLGLLRESDGLAAQMLMDLGLKLPDVRQEVLKLFETGVGDAPIDVGLKAPADAVTAEMPVRLTDGVRKAMALAEQEARRLNHEHVGAEHILLGLAKEGTGVAALALRNLGVDARRLHLEVEKLGTSGVQMLVMGRLPEAPQVKDVIRYAMEEARLHHCPVAGTGHVLLGLLGEAGGIVTQIMANLGLQLEDVRQAVQDLYAAGIQDMPGNLEPIMADVCEEDVSCRTPGPGPNEGPWQSYRDLPVWQKADELARQVYAMTGGFPEEQVWDLASQFRKAALSIPPAIAEAHRCQNKATARWLLYGALAALADVQYLVLFSSRLGHLKDQDGRIVKNLAEDLDGELRRFCGSLES